MPGRVICIMARMLDQDDGLYVYARNLLEQLLAIDTESQYLILLRTDKRAALFERFENARVEVLPARIKTVWDQVTVPLAARRARADLIFNPKFSIPLLAGRPCAFVLQGSDWYVNPQNYPWWDNLYIRATMPLYVRKAGGLLAISQTVVDDLAGRLPIDRASVEISYAAAGAGFTARRDDVGLARFRAEHALPGRFILTVARGYHTGHGRQPAYPGGNNERLLRGYRRYRQQGGTLPLVIAGARIEPYLRDRGFSDADFEGIHFVGFIPHDDMPRLYQLAESFVIATLNESFCFPLVEAMACGCPAIVPSTGACPEIGGDAVRLIDPYDVNDIGARLFEVEREPVLRSTMRLRGLERARRYSWRETARRTLRVFEALAPATSRAVRAT